MDVRDRSLNLRGGFELWGFPGAGKSTQAALLRNRPEVSLVDFNKLGSCALKRPLNAAKALSDGRLLTGIVNGLFRSQTYEAEFSRLAVCQHAALDGRPRHLIEEGLTHEIWRALFARPEYLSSGPWREFVRHAGPNIIVLQLNPQEALRRILTKKSPGPVNQELALGQIGDAVWRKAAAAYEAVLSEIQRAPQISCRTLDVGHLTTAEVSDEIVKIVRSNSRSVTP